MLYTDKDGNQLLAYDLGRSRFGSNYKTVLCRVYKCAEGDHNMLSNPLDSNEKAGE